MFIHRINNEIKPPNLDKFLQVRYDKNIEFNGP
jgi:hypothetical protein